MKKNVLEAKKALDRLISKGRSHLYKPIQIGEILYHHRVMKDVDLDNLESYRNKSKKWRNDVTKVLVGKTSTSSAKYQDNLFDENAMPPRLIKTLALENVRTHGAVEAYIYNRFTNKLNQLAKALDLCNNATKDDFCVKSFIDSFWNEPGLKRSLDKIYEIVVYSLFSTLVEQLNLQVEISVDSTKLDILSDFQDFAKMVMCIDVKVQNSSKQRARVYRVGVTNAADRGLDMYSNWGPAIQIKHLSLDVELAESIVTSISSDRIVIVCKDAEKDVIVSLLNQIGWRSRIQSIVTENDLVKWYEKALRGKHSKVLGDILLAKMRMELVKEFPSIDETPEIIKKRKYASKSHKDWT